MKVKQLHFLDLKLIDKNMSIDYKSINFKRVKEIVLMMGFPITGVLFSINSLYDLLNLHFFFFIIAIYSLFLSVYSFNDLCGNLKTISDVWEIQKFDKKNKKYFFVAIATFLLSLSFLYFLGKDKLILGIVIFILWTFYSFPEVGFKNFPILGTIVHFLAQIYHFYLGFLLYNYFSFNSFLIAIYFSLLFSIGHINHELIDYNDDKNTGINTGAIYFGIKKWKVFQLLLIVISMIYVSFLVNICVLNKLEGYPFLIASFLHVLNLLVLSNKSSRGNIFMINRFLYRIYYLFAGLTFIIIKMAN